MTKCKSDLGEPDLLAQRHEALFDDVPLGLGEGSAAGQPVDGVQHGVDHDGPVFGTGEERGALGDERQHGRTQVPVQRQGHLRGAERSLRGRDSDRQEIRTPRSSWRELVWSSVEGVGWLSG